MPELLTGTVTFLFTDIEGSTRLLQAHSDRWSAILTRHQEILRNAFLANGGVEVGTEGDSFFVAFPTAPAAVTAAAEIQRALAREPWPEDAGVRVRIGMHTGEATFAADGYVGLHVHRASRIASAAHGGQILLSDATRSLVGDALSDGLQLRDLGTHRLKDLERPERLWQVVVPGLAAEFPPLASLDAVANNLPHRLTTFLGRETEIAAISELLGRSRLLTLTGPGGTGKTRLSLEVASRSITTYPDGVYFVELASITEPDLVPETIAQTLHLPDRGGRRAVERLLDHIGERRMLLVLDNFEQVIDAAASVNELLGGCPQLSVMVSSRSVLRVSGEQEYPVPPLGVPDLRNLPPLEQLSRFEAVALFIERARAVKPAFEVTDDNAAAVAEICARLDGLPLAIELAAARIRIFTPQAMLGRLDRSLTMLAGGSRDLPERQQTLRSAIAWSHDMLDETDRSLFASLSVFVGGAGLEAIEGVCGSEVSGEVLDALSSLVEKSLIREVDGCDGQPRFVMLETIREFGVEQAVERGRWEALRDRHCRHFVTVAETSAVHLMRADKREWLDRLEQDHDNFRAAMLWAVERGSVEHALRIGSALWRFMQMRGHLAEGLERIEAALARDDGVSEVRANALSAAAGLAYWLADTERSRRHYRDEIAVRTAIGDRRGLAEAYYSISFTWTIIGTSDSESTASALRFITMALEIFRELGDELGIARCEWALANLAWGTGDVAGAKRHGADALAYFRSSDDAFMLAWASYTYGLAELADEATDTTSSDATGAARPWFAEALRIFHEAQDVTGYTLVLDALATVALRNGDRSHAARLSGAVAQFERTSGTGLNAWNRQVLRFDPSTLRDDPELADDWAAGERMDADEAYRFAVGV